MNLNLIFSKVMNLNLKNDWIQRCTGLLFQVMRALLHTVRYILYDFITQFMTLFKRKRYGKELQN